MAIETLHGLWHRIENLDHITQLGKFKNQSRLGGWSSESQISVMIRDLSNALQHQVDTHRIHL
jgi:hypothetical protein